MISFTSAGSEGHTLLRLYDRMKPFHVSVYDRPVEICLKINCSGCVDKVNDCQNFYLLAK